MPRSEVQLLRQLYFNRTGILFLFMALASIGMLAASSKSSGVAGQLWLALGSATLATTGYSFVQVLLTTRQFNDFLTDAIKSDIRSAMTAASAESMEQFRAFQTQYVPVATYPALDAANPGFNSDLNASITASDHYVFRGMTARYALARLSQLPRVPREIKIIVADPTKPGAVDFRARRDAGTGDEAAFNKAKKELLDGIHTAIAGAYSFRRRFDKIEFVLTSVPHIDRMEITDDAIYISRFSGDEGLGARFPPSAKFGRESFTYQMFVRDCNSLLASEYLPRIEISGSRSEDEFLARLQALNLDIDRLRWNEMKQMFEDFRSAMKPQLVPLGNTGGDQP